MIFVFDCGPLNRNPAVAMALLQWLCDTGMCKCAIGLFLQLHHSKELSDMYFGVIESIFDNFTLISLDNLMEQIDKLTTNEQTKEKMMARKLNPMALVGLKEMLEAIYSLGPNCTAPSELKFTGKDFHCFTAVQDRTEVLDILEAQPRRKVYEDEPAFKYVRHMHVHSCQ